MRRDIGRFTMYTTRGGIATRAYRIISHKEGSRCLDGGLLRVQGRSMAIRVSDLFHRLTACAAFYCLIFNLNTRRILPFFSKRFQGRFEGT
jgi:hypothetical protein